MTRSVPATIWLVTDMIRVIAVAARPSGGYFRKGGPAMNYQAFTNESLTMMYEGVRGALRADDALEQGHRDPVFRVRETPDWKRHAADLETEMLKRGMLFEVIDWSEAQATLPFDE
jgi:hypothetical protein